MYKNILVPVDLATNIANKVCETAEFLAKQSNSKVTLMTIIPDYGMPVVASFFPEDAQAKLKKEVLQKLQELAAKHFSVEVDMQLAQGKPAREILEYASKTHPDLIVIGCRKKKSRANQRLLGSCGSGVTDRASCAVLVVR